ncbi:DNA-binding protein, partial [Dietzia sp. B44]|uniref:DNA-binding protein n=1 Tax=Dietzia sp. B44 TaxID=1630633 RepID=UPI00321FFED9
MDPSGLVFDAEEVGGWLNATGRGNNPEAQEDAALFSSLMGRAASKFDDASALLLLHALSGAPLADQSSDDLAMLPVGHGVEEVLSVEQAGRALRDHDLVACIDRLAEAGVTATRVLNRLARLQEAKDSPLASESLTAKGDALACEVVAALAGDSDRALVPWGPGGLRLLASVVARSSESDRPRVVAPDDPTGPVDRLLWRYLAALGAHLEPATNATATLLVGHWAAIPRDRTESFFDTIDNVVLGLEPGSAAVVFAPAPLLVDELPGTDHRRRILSGTGGDYVAPLRYVARLPRGLCRFGGRRRMALWVLGESGDTAGARSFTTFGEHSAHALDTRENRALASDAVAALRGGAARRSHAFLRSEHRLTEAVVSKSALALPVTTDVAEDGGDALARLWEKRDASASGVLDGVEVVAAGSAADHSLPWRAATTGTHRPARVITGVRIPAEVFAAG